MFARDERDATSPLAAGRRRDLCCNRRRDHPTDVRGGALAEVAPASSRALAGVFAQLKALPEHLASRTSRCCSAAPPGWRRAYSPSRAWRRPRWRSSAECPASRALHRLISSSVPAAPTRGLPPARFGASSPPRARRSTSCCRLIERGTAQPSPAPFELRHPELVSRTMGYSLARIKRAIARKAATLPRLTLW